MAGESQLDELPVEAAPAERRLVWRFAVRSALVLVVVGVVLHLVVATVMTRHFTDAAEFHAEFVADAVLEPLLADAELQGMSTPELSRAITEDGLDGDVMHINIWRPDGSLLASDGTAEAIDLALLDDRIDTTLSEGTRTLKITNGDRDVLSTWIPTNEVAPYVIEVIQDRAGALAAARQLTRVVDIGIVAALVLLWSLLLPMMRRVTRRMAEQHRQLREQHAELQRLFEVEHSAVAHLQEVNDLQDAFITSISHELRTPLTVVSGMLTTLDRHGADLDDEQRARFVGRARVNAARLDDLLRGVLDLGNAQQHGHDISRTPQDVRHAVESVASQLPPREVEFDLTVPTVHADGQRFERALLNLLSNAIRHTPDDSPVTVATRTVPNGVDLIVADRGPGVPDDLKLEVFKPFRHGPIDDAHSPGVGIGLALVARFAHLHGGRAWVQDRAGGGAEFHVLLRHRVGESADDPQRLAGTRVVAAQSR